MSNMTPQEAASRIHLGSAVVWLVAGLLFAFGPLPIWGFILLAAAHVLVGVAWTRWLGFGKTLTVLLALLQVLIVPVGTVIAVLLLWASIKSGHGQDLHEPENSLAPGRRPNNSLKPRPLRGLARDSLAGCGPA